MEEKELQKLLRERLYMELYLFKHSMLRKTKKDIYEASYKIEVFVNVYEILLEETESLGPETAWGLLCQRHGILESLYQEWLRYNDSSFDELKAYVGSGLGAMAREGISCGREEEDGEGHGQAA